MIRTSLTAPPSLWFFNLKNRIKHTILAAASTVAITGMAATPAPSQTADWSGKYAGAQIGYGTGNADWVDNSIYTPMGIGTTILSADRDGVLGAALQVSEAVSIGAEYNYVFLGDKVHAGIASGFGPLSIQVNDVDFHTVNARVSVKLDKLFGN